MNQQSNSTLKKQQEMKQKFHFLFMTIRKTLLFNLNIIKLKLLKYLKAEAVKILLKKNNVMKMNITKDIMV
jgi:hypothetical protein